MKLYRYMSDAEFDKLMSGERIYGRQKDEPLTADNGIRFLTDRVRVDSYRGHRQFSAAESYEFLRGSVAPDRFVEFEVSDGMESKFQQFDCEYEDPWSDDWKDAIVVEEMCTPYYDIGMLTPTRVATPPNFYWSKDRWTDNPDWTKNPDWREVVTTGQERATYIAEQESERLTEKFHVDSPVRGAKGGRLPERPGTAGYEHAGRSKSQDFSRRVADLPEFGSGEAGVSSKSNHQSSRSLSGLGLSDGAGSGSSRDLSF